MTALLLSVGAFAVWSLLGLALLVALRADVQSLVVLLTAPVLGASLLTMTTFGLSRAGLAVEDFAIAETVVFLVAAIALLAWRRPSVLWTAALPAGIAAASILLIGSPLFELGFRWIANANDDMSNYVLAAERLFRHGFSAPLDVSAFVSGRDYAEAAQSLQASGARPGSQLLLAWLEGVSGRSAKESFMPLILALNACCICAAAALAAQAKRRLVAAVVAAALLAIAPLATFGVVQQLVAQVFGLAIGAALAAILLRPELHEQGSTLADKVLVGFLTASLALVYVEIGVIFFIAYVGFLGLMAVQRRIRVRPVLLLWGPALLVALLLLNTYAIDEARYLSNQAGAGGKPSGDPPLFGFIFVPSSAPAILGVRLMPFESYVRLNFWIVVSLLVGILTLGIAVVCAWRAQAVGFVILASAVVALGLVIARADFGVFKLSMYVQPFVAAAIAVAIADATRRVIQVAAAAALLVWLVPAVDTQRKYVDRSRDPLELRHGSSQAVFPAFDRIVDRSNGPVVSATANPVLAKLEASTARGEQVFFVGREMFRSLLGKLAREAQGGTFKQEAATAVRDSRWTPRFFVLPRSGGEPQRRNLFAENPLASRALSSGNCTLVLGTGSQGTLNRRALPDNLPDLVARQCSDVRNMLLFVHSELGQNYYLPTDRKRVSLYQLENDVFFDGTFASAGRYALFQVLGPSREVRLCIDFTRTLARDGDALPPASVIGAKRASFPLVGRGSARVCSPAVAPQVIAGQPYVMLDMGVDGRLPVIPRKGLLGLYGKGYPVDPRSLTSYVRDISAISADEYARMSAPSAIASFPADLRSQDLEYSGIYEDGWVADRSYATLAGGPTARLRVEGENSFGGAKSVVVRVNGRVLSRQGLDEGPFRILARAPASKQRRKVELRFSSSALLPSPDDRPASAHLTFLGLERP